MMQKELTTKKDYAAVGEEISHELAADFMKAYQDTHVGENGGYQIGRNIIDQILAQPGCVGMHFYYGLNEDGVKTLVYVGIDADGKDIVKRTVITSNGDLTIADGIFADRIKWASSKE
jgi:UDP-N-acetylglucosamine enolpyruvyl transferase